MPPNNFSATEVPSDGQSPYETKDVQALTVSEPTGHCIRSSHKSDLILEKKQKPAELR